MANRTVHGVMHIAWVADDAGDYRGQMAVLVKPNPVSSGRHAWPQSRRFGHLLVPSAAHARDRAGVAGQDAARSAREPWRHGH